MLLFENVFDDANNLVNDIASYDVHAAEEHLAEPAAAMKPFHSNIILNQPNENVFFDDQELENYLKDTDIRNNPELADLWSQFNMSMRDPKAMQVTEPKEEHNNIRLTHKIMDTYKLNSEEREYFYDIAVGQGVYYVFPFALTVENNEVMHVILEYLLVFKYLVYALIALKASCEFTATGDPRHDRTLKKCTAICMRLLVAAFGDLKNNEYSLWHIEGLILTVLVLTMLFSDMNFVDTKQPPISWISHLRDGRALLVKYNSIKSQMLHYKPDSHGITIAKLLFFCYEWLSKMSLPLHLITQDDLADLWLIAGFASLNELDNHVLEKLRVIIPRTSVHSDFNLFMSLSTGVIDIAYKLLDLFAIINAKRSHDESYHTDPTTLANIMAMIDKTLQDKIVPGSSSETCIIPRENVMHPLYPDESSRLLLPLSAYGRDTDRIPEVVYSWCDVAVQLHVYCIYLKILTSPGLLLLPRSHPMISEVIKKLLNLMFFLKPKSDPAYRPELALAETENYYLSKCLFDSRAIMVQLAFRMCIDLTDSPDDFEKLELYFRGLTKLGCGCCILALKRLDVNKRKSKERASKVIEGTYHDLNYLAEGFPIY